MLGAIIGDIAGSIYEGRRTIGRMSVYFGKFNHYTDDSVMTLAIGDALINIGNIAVASEEDIKNVVAKSMRFYGRREPHAGYGSGFKAWFMNDDKGPYNSFGNGSAMRVSSVGWLFNTLERTLEVAKWTAEVTHNHPEGVKGAQAVAGAIYLARTNHTKEYIKNWLSNELGYEFLFSAKELTKKRVFDVTCQGTIPIAFTGFFESNSFNDCMEKTVSFGGDCDTNTAIACSVAEAFYGIDDKLVDNVINTYLPYYHIDVLENFYEFIGDYTNG